MNKQIASERNIFQLIQITKNDMKDEEKIMILRLKAGDTTVFEQVYRAYYRLLYSYVLDILENRMFVEDIIEEVFLNLWEKRETLEIKSSLKTYLLVAARNKSLDYIRKRNVRIDYKNRIEKKIELERNYNYFKIIDSDSFQQKELKKLIATTIEDLPKKCKRVFKLSRKFKMKNKEIARHLSISENTVEKHMGTAINRLKNVIFKYYNG